MSWYYVTNQGETKGTFTIDQLVTKYRSHEITDNSYVWNGTTVAQWTPVKNVNQLVSAFKSATQVPKNIRPPPRKLVQKRKAAPGRPSRANLLASIRSGNPKLKKVSPPKSSNTSSKVGNIVEGSSHVSRKPSNNNARNSNARNNYSTTHQNNHPKKHVDFASEMAAKLQQMKARKSSRNSDSSPPKKQIRDSYQGANKISDAKHRSSSFGTRISVTESQIDQLKKKLEKAQKWQIKAIAAILKDD